MSTQRRRVLEGSGKLVIPADGVYIEGLDGRAYTVDEWHGGDTANSVVAASGDVKFRIALTDAPSQMGISSDYTDPLENYMAAISGETEAMADYDGAQNTAKILQMQPSTGYAAGYCDAFVFPDGKTKGFLPSLGQLWLAYQNKAAVDAALVACSGTAMTTSHYWTSTFSRVSGSRRRCWVFGWNYGSAKDGNLNYDNYVRPFANLD